MTGALVYLRDLERGESLLELEPGESIDVPTDRVAVDVLEDPEPPWGWTD